MSPLLLVAAWLATAVFLTAQSPARHAIAVAGQGWRTTGDVSVVRILDRPALRCGSGAAYYPDLRFRDGTIEFDVATTGARSFVGVRFRAAADEVWEEIYFRPHKAGLPDAVQYAPSFAASVSNWQLYHGPNDSAAVAFTPNTWTHVRVVVQGNAATVYLGEDATPALASSLAHEPRDGYIGFWCLDARDPKTAGHAAAISNIVVTPGRLAVDLPVPKPTPVPAGVIARWDVSPAFAAPASGAVTEIPLSVRDGDWQPAATESNGLLIFDRFVPRPGDARRVAAAARLRLTAERPKMVTFEFGYSDDASVFLNGTLLYSGVNGYSYNFPRRDGLITIDHSTLYLPLTTGVNELVVVVSETFGGWGLLGRIAGDGGRASAIPQNHPLTFEDDFERGLDAWLTTSERYVRTEDSGDPAHGRVLVLEPGGDVYVLLRDSGEWGSVRLEGDVMFPTDEDNYLGVAYNFQRRDDRTDFGLVYIKGNDSYLQANPHHDMNVGRTLYPEFQVPLRADAAIVTGRWQRFAVEVVGGVCHFYVGDMTTPQMTFPFFDHAQGLLGLQPRSVGGPVWVDNVRVTTIDRFTYAGPPRPSPDYAPDALLTEWQVLGPLTRTDDAVAVGSASNARWRPFAADPRGAVITARVVDHHGPATVAYFRTRVTEPAARRATLHLSTVDDLALWINGRFHWFVPRGPLAWFDFWNDPKHEGRRIPIDLQAGSNDIVLRVRGGIYASGGFFARLDARDGARALRPPRIAPAGAPPRPSDSSGAG